MGVDIEQWRAAIGGHSIWLCSKLSTIFLKIMFQINMHRNYLYATNVTNMIFSLLLISILNISYLMIIISFLLIMHGIELNPGPDPLHPLKFCHLNARSLLAGVDKNQLLEYQTSKFDDIELILCKDHSFDIIAISETWLSDQISSDYIALSGYQLPFRKDRNLGNGHGGGVCVYVKSDLTAIRRNDLENVSSEMLWVEVILSNNQKILFGVVYRPPNQSAIDRDTFLDNLSWSLNIGLSETPSCLICVGDFNDRCLNWIDDHAQSELGVKLKHLIQDMHLFQLVDQPTRVTEDSAYILDLVITDSPGYMQNVGQLMPLANMDHNVVYGELKISRPVRNNIKREMWHYKNADIIGLNQSLGAAPWHIGHTLYENIDDMTDYFQRLLLDTAKEYIPVKQVSIRSKDKPWFNGYIRKLIRLRNRWTGVFQRTLRLEHKALRDAFRALVHDEIEKAKERHRLYLKQKLDDPHINIKTYHSITKSLYGAKVHSGIPILREGDRSIADDTEKANLFCNQYVAQCTLPPLNIDFSLPNFRYITDSRIDNCVSTPAIVKKILLGLNVNKATGPDGISYKLLKISADSISGPLSNLFNKSVEMREFPSQWKKGNWFPVYKRGEKCLKENYRPVSLLSCPSKIFERVIFMQLYKYFTDNNLLTERNSGFKPRDSTVNQLIHITQSIYNSLNDGKDVCMVFLDVSKAFDKVYHDGLLFKLKQMGVCGNLLDWIRSYLANRQQQVVINGKSSGYHHINCGVPQGSVLGPLLFLVYINDIVDNLESTSYLFADDQSLWKDIDKNDPNETESAINQDLETLHSWSLQWLLPFNANKTVYMIFSKRRNKPNFSLYLGGSQIQEVTSHTHLGLIFQENMSWNLNIDQICKKCSKRVFGLRLIQKLVPRKTLVNLYKTMVRPVIEYACAVYDNLNLYETVRLERIQRNAALIVTGAFTRTATDKLLEDLGWNSLADRRKFYRMSTMYKITHDLTPNYLKRLLPMPNVNRTRYNLRNIQDLTLVHSKKQYHAKSFFPKSVREWNQLPIDLRNSPSITTFKNQYKKANMKKENQLYNVGFGIGQTNHTRMRLGLSALRAHLFQYTIVDSPICTFCNMQSETEIHYIFHCPTFAAQRAILLANIVDIMPYGVLAALGERDLAKTLLFGSERLTFQTNCKLFEAFQEFIVNTKRFNFQ